ncbi:MAG TPA: ribokinase [Candidatus Humimicrobiaceae bacterium]
MGSGKKMSIMVIGSSNFDINLMVKDIPVVGETILSSGMEIGYGGKGGNQAFTISKIGGSVDYLTCIGDDVFGGLYREEFRKNNFNMDYIKVIKNKPNGIAVINIDENGRNTIVVYPGSSRSLTPDIIRENLEVILSHDIIMTQLEIPVETAEYLARTKTDKNIFILNPSPVDKNYNYSQILKSVDILMPNEIELSQLANLEVKEIEDIREATVKLLLQGVKNMVVTLGKKGVFIKNAALEQYIEAPDVSVIDTAGAGDAFAGAFMYDYSINQDIIKAASFANKVATISVTRRGTHKSVPTRQEIEQMADFFKD